MLLSRETEGGLFLTGMCICMQFVMVMKLCKYNMHFQLCFVLFHADSEVISGTDEVSLTAACNP